MTVSMVLYAALKVVRHDHTATELAVDIAGRKVQPRSPAAVRWSSTGALCKVAPRGAPSSANPLTAAGYEACLLLDVAREELGEWAWSIHAVDEAGVDAVIRMFSIAIDLARESEPDTPRPRPAVTAGAGVGSHPRGVPA